MKIHFVKSGDTLYAISQKYGVSVEEILAVNSSVTDPNQVRAGVKLVIPENNAAPQLQPSNIPAYPNYNPNQEFAASANQMYPYSNQSIHPYSDNPIPSTLASGTFSYPTVPSSMPSSMPSTPAWSMPTGYTPYNTPYHMTNYYTPNYQGYSAGLAQNPTYGSNEYYNTYSSLQSEALLPNPQPHGSLSQLQTSPETNEAQQGEEYEEETEESSFIYGSSGQLEEKKARTSSTLKLSNSHKKKNSLREQVIRMQQTRRKKRR